MVGETISDYKVLEKIGEEGIGLVRRLGVMKGRVK